VGNWTTVIELFVGGGELVIIEEAS